MTAKPSWSDMVEEEEKEKQKKSEETGLEKSVERLGTEPSGKEEDDGKLSLHFCNQLPLQCIIYYL
jgi:hypothetical protein